jgi:hypothetical protein
MNIAGYAGRPAMQFTVRLPFSTRIPIGQSAILTLKRRLLNYESTGARKRRFKMSLMMYRRAQDLCRAGVVPG